MTSQGERRTERGSANRPVKPGAGGERWTGLLLCCGAIIVVRIGLAIALHQSGARLGDTEAYYLSWAMDPSIGYHDHPGMVAWVLACVGAVVGDPVVTARVTAISSLLATLLLVCGYFRRQAGLRTALAGLVWFVAIPMFGTGGLLVAPDTILAPLWVATLLVLERSSASTSRRDSLRQLLSLGALCALAVATKWFAVVLVFAVVVELIVAAPRGERLRRVAAFVAIAGMGAIPALIFEIGNDFSGARYHLLERHGDLLSLRGPLQLLGGQVLGLSPILAGLIGFGIVSSWRRRHGAAGRDAHSGPRARAVRLTLTTLGPLLILSAVTTESEPHWPVLGYLPLLGLVAGELSQRLPRVSIVAVATGVILQTVAWIHLVAPGMLHHVAEVELRYDLAGDLRGWDDAAAQAELLRIEHDAATISSYHYTVCGQLAAAQGDLDTISCLSARRDAFDFLVGGKVGSLPPGSDTIYVRDHRYDDPGPDRLICRHWGPPREVVVTNHGQPIHRYELQPCFGFVGISPVK